MKKLFNIFPIAIKNNEWPLNIKSWVETKIFVYRFELDIGLGIHVGIIVKNTLKDLIIKHNPTHKIFFSTFTRVEK